MGEILNNVESPCIRNCCLDANDLCVGCFRTLEEILSWSESLPEAKQQILLNCQNRKSNIQQSSCSAYLSNEFNFK
ncbi:DUF1289 domain-containing protein [Paraglaciecola sp.]|uniref:DUF1289 domain-containing protein n=1 Tax=Paraglaciecola sp. TaxID=1920173 RepID=UPI0030F46F0A